MVSWAKNNGIAIGPGRGSAAGSLIAYLLTITEVDPIEYNLIFERFLNPERVTMPDIDIDIQDTRREEVVKYMFNKYGSKYTGAIITFQRLGAKMSIRDTGKFLKISVGQIDQMSKLIPMFSTLQEAYKKSAAFRAVVKRTDENTKLFNIAQTLEGLPRQVGTHAAGIIVTKQPLENIVPTLLNAEGYTQTQYSMEYLERNGLLKIDLLGLKNLTIIQDIEKLIQKNYHKKLDIKKISFHDPQTNKLLSKGDTNGIFQLESFGMKSTVASVGVDSINDLTAIISLYRPGPMDNIAIYSERKKHQNFKKQINEEYSNILKETYGIIVYQEQVMEIATKFSGMSLSKADLLRRAISKKNSAKMHELKAIFINGAIKKGYSQIIANDVYQSIEKFADYGFNKSHAVAYAFIAYRMAFLKARFPLEFYIALLESSKGSQKSVIKYIEEAKIRRINIISPAINLSKTIVFNSGNDIILPLIIIKGFGKVANLKIISEREKNGNYKNFFDFVSRVKIIGVGNAIIQTLIFANALREFGNMQTLIDSFPSSCRFVEMITIKDKDGNKTLDMDLITKPELIISQRNIDFEITSEVKLFGFKLNAFQTDKYQRIEKLSELNEKNEVHSVVYLEKIFRKRNKNDEEFAKVIISDNSATIEVVIFTYD